MLQQNLSFAQIFCRLSVTVLILLPLAARADDKVNKIESNIRVPVVIKDHPKNYSLQDRMEYYEVPGLSVAVIERGSVIWSKGLLKREKAKK